MVAIPEGEHHSTTDKPRPLPAGPTSPRSEHTPLLSTPLRHPLSLGVLTTPCCLYPSLSQSLLDLHSSWNNLFLK